MDFITVLIFIGFILAGIIIGYPVGYAVARKQIANENEPYCLTCVMHSRLCMEYKDVLEAEVIE